MKTTNTSRLAASSERAHKVHDKVCDIHYDESVMNPDGTCSECQDDHHELEIMFRS